jgi:hypothetical protein
MGGPWLNLHVWLGWQCVWIDGFALLLANDKFFGQEADLMRTISSACCG